MTIPIHVVGIVATDPHLKTVGNGIQLCSFRLGSTQRKYDRNTREWVDGETSWFTVNIFHSLAENAAASFAKGDRVLVGGRLQVRQWERDERSGTSVDIEADSIGHDLRWGTSVYTKRRVEPREHSDENEQRSRWSTPFGAEADETAAVDMVDDDRVRVPF